MKYFIPYVLFFTAIFLHVFTVSNKIYVIALISYFILSYLHFREIPKSLWWCFLCILPFQRSRSFIAAEIPATFWEGSWNVVIEYMFVFSDVILLLLIYKIFSGSLREIYINLRSKSNIFQVENVLIFFLFMAAVFASTQSTFFELALYWFGKFALLMGLYFVSQNLTLNEEGKEMTVQVMIMHAGVMSLLIMVQFLKGSQLGIGLEHALVHQPYGSIQVEANNIYRPGGYFFDPNLAATWLCMTLPFIVFGTVFSKYTGTRILLVSMCMIAIILTRSRLALLLLMVVGGGMGFYFRNQFHQAITQNKKVFMIGTVFLVLLMPLIISRLSDFQKTFQPEGGWEYRTRQNALAGYMMSSNPWGVGVNMFQYEVLGKVKPQYFSSDVTQPHNLFMEVGTGVGWAGLVIFSLLIYVRLKRHMWELVAHHNPDNLAIIGSIVCYLVLAQGYPWLMRAPIAEFFWIVLGMRSIQVLKPSK